MTGYTFKAPKGLQMRYTEESDAQHLRQWFDEPGMLRWFPMQEPAEVDDTVRRLMHFSTYKASLTAVLDDVPCGMAILYLHPYRKLMHQCEFGVFVSSRYRNRRVGSDLVKNLMHLAKANFKLELLHLQVYEGNPAIRLYKRFGFHEFGRQAHWIKEKDGNYRGRVFMEKELDFELELE